MSIAIIHRRDIIRQVRERWNKQYPSDDYRFWDNTTAGEIRPRLNALNLETCAPEDVEAAIRVGGWGNLNCDECDADVPALVRIGEEPDYEARWRDVCSECLAKAAAILAETKPLQ